MKKPCRYPGCPAILDHGGYCEKHASHKGQAARDYEIKRKRDPVLAFNHKIRTGKRWLNVRKIKLAANPLCEDPHGIHARRGDTESAKQVHHIKGLSTHPELAYHLDNLMAVCCRCHAKIELDAKRDAATD